MLTEGLWRPDLRRSWVVGEVRRWVVAGLTEIGRNGVAPGPWTPWIGVGCSCGGGGRVSATGAKPAASNFPKLSSPSTAGSGKNSGACRAWTGGKRARRGSWCRGGTIAGFGRGYCVAELLDRGGAEPNSMRKVEGGHLRVPDVHVQLGDVL